MTISFASGAELETQLEIALMLGFVDNEQKESVSSVLTEVMKMLNVMLLQMVSKTIQKQES